MNCPFCNAKIKHFPLSIHYHCPNCGEYQMDFGFKSQLDNFKSFYPDKYQQIIDEIKKEFKKKTLKKLFLVESTDLVDEDPNVYYLELNDFANRIGLDLTSNSRGSDYGD